MIRVRIVCEGQTEETFVKELLAQHFNRLHIFVQPALIGRPGKKGGGITASKLILDCREHLRDKTVYCTTFFDFYGLPGDFPGKAEAEKQRDIAEKARCVQTRLAEQLQAQLGDGTSMDRFIPYVQMYEYEGLLFSDPARFAQGIDHPALAPKFQEIRREFTTPEDINDSPNTAPSRRVIKLIPGYEKPLLGTLAALEIGLETIRRECRLFDDWIKRLEALARSHAN